MKIIVYSKKTHPKFIALAKAFKKKKADVLYSNDLNADLLNNVQPNYIFADTLDFNAICPVIHLHNNESTTHHLEFNLETLDPFIDEDLYSNPSFETRYQSDIVYTGDPKFIQQGLDKFLNMEYNIKLFGQPCGVWCYAGMVNEDQYQHLYKSSKVCLVHSSDIYSQYAIVLADNIPVIFDSPQDIERVITDALNKDIRPFKFTKKEILNKHTAHNRLNIIINKLKLPII